MPPITIIFHGNLNDFLPKDKKGLSQFIDLKGHETIKHVIEVCGVPHPEVGAILINGKSVGFEDKPSRDDKVDVFPFTFRFNSTKLVPLRPDINHNNRFILDTHLGKLAVYLRLLGFDTLYRNDFEDKEIAEIARKENRMLLTRDRGLLKRKEVVFGYWVREKLPKKQIIEIVEQFDITEKANSFSRCSYCNNLLIAVLKEDVFDRLEPKTRIYYSEFRLCSECNRVYWKGSHFTNMEAFFELVLNR